MCFAVLPLFIFCNLSVFLLIKEVWIEVFILSEQHTYFYHPRLFSVCWQHHCFMGGDNESKQRCCLYWQYDIVRIASSQWVKLPLVVWCKRLWYLLIFWETFPCHYIPPTNDIWLFSIVSSQPFCSMREETTSDLPTIALAAYASLWLWRCVHTSFIVKTTQ